MNQIRFLLTCLVVGVVLCRGKRIPSYAGAWIADLERVYACDIPRNGFAVRATLSHFNPIRPFDPQHLSGYVNQTRDIDDSLWAKGKIDTRSNNQWKENAFVLNFPNKACSTARDNIPPHLAKYLHMGSPCVVREGFTPFSINMTWNYKNFPIMPYGLYRSEFTTGTPTKDWVACSGFILKIIPKP